MQATFIVLVTSSLLVTSRQYIGDPIDCIVEEIPQVRGLPKSGAYRITQKGLRLGGWGEY